MRHLLKTVSAAAAVAAGVLTVSAVTTGAAQAATPKPMGLYAPSDLVLTVGQGEDAATATVQRAVTLTCAPKASGTHPAPRAACAEAGAVGARFDALVNQEPKALCTKEWNPVIISVSGVWQGKHVAWTTTFGNPCTKDAALAEGALLNF
ncbi:SSI family serine proteinase inhibitor [Streptomyces sp. AN091965]|uniref:SSI family serine proteinase inhibitor n=1 Tax=Streptomyces sp. AN091965 TaxID=2927803 RepID=UPI001F624145|nr:SSI family serine proteinase inhibitor [Streptomyces sp. AN091965]MCI3929006.1 SSI family serine proteinase inhibitor [Streptomyces sp. AN091965]